MAPAQRLRKSATPGTAASDASNGLTSTSVVFNRMLKFPSNSKPPWFFLLLILFVRSSPAQSSAQAIVWHPWSDGVFTQAAREHKLVLLNLEASWCHWCHVMDHQTYNDPAVQELIGKNYIAVKVDQELAAGCLQSLPRI